MRWRPYKHRADVNKTRLWWSSECVRRFLAGNRIPRMLKQTGLWLTHLLKPFFPTLHALTWRTDGSFRGVGHTPSEPGLTERCAASGPGSLFLPKGSVQVLLWCVITSAAQFVYPRLPRVHMYSTYTDTQTCAYLPSTVRLLWRDVICRGL